jgi:hypothetical protein
MHDEPEKNSDAIGDARTSRREWLLNLGSTIVLTGTTGMVHERMLPATQAGQAVATGSAAALPPGLYVASVDHLTHIVTRDGPFVTIPPGAETEYLRPRDGPYHPEFFAPDEFDNVRRLVEIILGEDLKQSAQTAVPGGPEDIYEEVAEWIDIVAANAPQVRTLAKSLSAEQRALAVAYFGGEKPVIELETATPDRVLREGLVWLTKSSQQTFAKDFIQLSAEEQLGLVTSINDVHALERQANAGTRLFELLKREVAQGFYTSRVGLGELDAAASRFHPESPGCVAKLDV